MEFDDRLEPINPRTLERLKRLAFIANHRAKRSTGLEREAHYRRKDAAINALLKLRGAFVDEVDWRQDDPPIGVWFLGGGQLHIPTSRVDLQAFKEVRAQLEQMALPAA